MHVLISMFAACITLLRLYNELKGMILKHKYHNFEIIPRKLSAKPLRNNHLLLNYYKGPPPISDH